MSEKLSQLVAFGVMALVLIYIKPSIGQVQQRPADEGETSNSRLGLITGRVVADGQPVANATVVVSRLNPSGRSRTVPTDDEGRFEIKGLEPGLFRINVNAPSYVPPSSDIPDGQELHRIGESVTINLKRGGVITGKVLNAAGEPVVAVRVRAIMIRDANNKKKSLSGIYGLVERPSDDRGIYRLYGLQPGTYIVSAGGFSNYFDNAYTSQSPTYAPSSNRDTADEISVASGEEVKDIDIRYRGESGHFVTGSATDSGVVNPRFQIVLASVRNGIIEENLSTTQSVSGTGFMFKGVPDGEYEIWAGSGSPGGEFAKSEPRRITIKGADVTGIKLVTKPLPSIAGQIVLVDSKEPDCKGKRRPNYDEMLVTAQPDPTVLQPAQFFSEQGSPNRAGEFLMRNLSPGQIRLNARFFAKYWFLQSIALPSPTASTTTATQVIDGSRNWIVLKPGDRVTGLKIVLAEGAASVQGVIELKDGGRIPRALYITLVPAEAENRENILRFFAVPVSDDGRFIVSNVPPGRYFVLPRSMQEYESDPASRLRLPDQSKTRAAFRRAAEAAKNEMELKPCQNLTDVRVPITQ